MPTFEIAVGPSIAKNLCTYRTPEADRRQTEDLATTVLSRSITHDRKGRKMPLEWSNEEDFRVWLVSEESEHGIKFIVSNTAHSESLLWREQHILKCAREWTGGWPVQNKLTTEGKDVKIQERKIPSKKTGCRCQLTIKFYQHTDTILGRYEDAHDHPLGDENLRFTWLTDRTRDLVMEMVCQGIESKVIVSNNLSVAYLTS